MASENGNDCITHPARSQRCEMYHYGAPSTVRNPRRHSPVDSRRRFPEARSGARGQAGPDALLIVWKSHLFGCEEVLGILGNSPTLRAFDGLDAKFAERFKLFSGENLRNVVFGRLRQQFADRPVSLLSG